MRTYFMRIIFIFVLLMSVPFVAYAETVRITPADVYRETERFRLSLKTHDLIDMQRYEAEEADHALRHPRHVIQKVRECHMLVSKILKTRNIDSTPLPKISSLREVRPADVLDGVKHLIDEMGKIGKVPVDVEIVVPDGAIVPNDVYNNLKRVCHAIRADIEPSDVLQVASTIHRNVRKIAKVRGYEIEKEVRQYTDKIPADVYAETWLFLDDLRTLALNPDFAIPGGVIVPNQNIHGEIVPADVIALMNDGLSETYAIKYALGLREYNGLIEYQGNKTPSDVFSMIKSAHEIVLMIIEKEAETHE